MPQTPQLLLRGLREDRRRDRHTLPFHKQHRLFDTDFADIEGGCSPLPPSQLLRQSLTGTATISNSNLSALRHRTCQGGGSQPVFLADVVVSEKATVASKSDPCRGQTSKNLPPTGSSLCWESSQCLDDSTLPVSQSPPPSPSERSHKLGPSMDHSSSMQQAAGRKLDPAATWSNVPHFEEIDSKESQSLAVEFGALADIDECASYDKGCCRSCVMNVVDSKLFAEEQHDVCPSSSLPKQALCPTTKDAEYERCMVPEHHPPDVFVCQSLVSAGSVEQYLHFQHARPAATKSSVDPTSPSQRAVLASRWRREERHPLRLQASGGVTRMADALYTRLSTINENADCVPGIPTELTTPRLSVSASTVEARICSWDGWPTVACPTVPDPDDDLCSETGRESTTEPGLRSPFRAPAQAVVDFSATS